jgi:hypothetical protein
MSHDSKQTKEYACRALRQMCVEEGIRGQVVQQGGLKACIAVVNDEDVEVRWLEPSLSAVIMIINYCSQRRCE